MVAGALRRKTEGYEARAVINATPCLMLRNCYAAVRCRSWNLQVKQQVLRATGCPRSASPGWRRPWPTVEASANVSARKSAGLLKIARF